MDLRRVPTTSPRWRFLPPRSNPLSDAKFTAITRYGEEGAEAAGRPKGTVMTTAFQVSWQIVPAVIGEIMNDPDPDKSGKAMKALLTMKKIDMATLLQAAGKRDAA